MPKFLAVLMSCAVLVVLSGCMCGEREFRSVTDGPFPVYVVYRACGATDSGVTRVLVSTGWLPWQQRRIVLEIGGPWSNLEPEWMNDVLVITIPHGEQVFENDIEQLPFDVRIVPEPLRDSRSLDSSRGCSSLLAQAEIDRRPR